MKTFKEFELSIHIAEGKKFSSSQLATLKAKYAEIDKINPSSPSFKDESPNGKDVPGNASTDS